MIRRFTLANGLRVVVDPTDAGPLAGIAVHYGVGYRSEPPGRAGFAHLFEHLMFDGSEHFPARGYLAEVLAAGGEASGTTHQDYTDYFHTVPAPALERALFAEADRMRAPRFTPSGLAEQLTGVEGEIRQAVHEAPLGGFPWPLLPALLFDTHPNAHDGYGDISALAGVTVADCEEFFRLHYGPGNAVLTVSGGGDARRVERLVTRHFEDIAPRPVPGPPVLTEPDLTGDRVRVRRFPGLPPGSGAVAVGYRLEDPSAGLEEYLAHLVLAELLGGTSRSVPADRLYSAACGFFGPLDAWTPDTLTVTLHHPGDGAPEETLRHLDRALEAAAHGLPGTEVALAARRVAAGLRRDGHGPTARARGLGRLELLFGRAELHDELPAHVGEIGAARVAAAARGLLAAHRAVLVTEPAPARTAVAPLLDTTPAGPSAPGPAPEGPREVPAAGPSRPLGLSAHTALGQPGTDRWRVVAVRDARAPLCEVRLRLTPQPGLSAALLHVHSHVLGARWQAQPLFATGGHTVRVEGGRVHLDGWFTTEVSPHWPALLGELVSAPVDKDELAAAAPTAASALHTAHRTEAGLLDHVLPHLLAGRPVPPLGPPLPAEALTADADGPGPWANGLVVLVGDIAEESVAARTLAALAPGAPDTAPDGAAPEGAAAVPVPPPTTPAPLTRPKLLHLPVPGPPRLIWTARERPYPARQASARDLAARYLAAVVLGSGHPSARLTRLTTPEAPLGFPVFAGRDTAYGAPRLFVTAQPPASGAARAALAVRAEILRLTAAPPTAQEVEAARRFADGQLHGIFETQTHLADRIAAWELLGLDTGHTAAFTEAVRNLTPAEVARACAAILPDPGLIGVLTGRTSDPEVTP
ncbi:insulinase family protein [Streptomyces sp. NPDC057099]|uniref:insulinase family protein n=1 Tax=Streptomyces sp. NPDC057099 TaxID=3346019 RepID=UPI003645700A